MKLLIITLIVLFSCQTNREAQLNKSDFEDLMNTVSAGWNTGNSKLAADCFSEYAVYIEPPNRQLYISRDSLFEFFGGSEGRSIPMKMTWHHLIFDEDEQKGTGEYTFEYKGRLTHGIVIIKINNRKIYRWREYQYRSKIDWLNFIGKSVF